VTLSRGGRVAGLVVLALLASGQGCGGGGGGGGGPVPGEERSFVFTVSVPGAPAGDLQPAFFRDEGLTQSGVTIASQGNPELATTSATVQDVDRTSGMPTTFGLAVHFDASGSIKDADRDPDPPKRFDAATAVVNEVNARRDPDPPKRFFAFRFKPGDSAYDPDRFKEVGSIGAARTEGADGFSPALTATINIIQALGGGSHAMLLLTDGENNAEDGSKVDLKRCGAGEASGRNDCSDDIGAVDTAAGSNVKVFVVGLGNVDSELEKFQELATATGGLFVKATRAEQLETQFRQLGALIADGGAVVTGESGVVRVNLGGNPFVRGWMRFNRNGASCPAGSQAHGGDSCKIRFGF